MDIPDFDKLKNKLPIHHLLTIGALVSERLFDLLVALLTMIIVEHRFGAVGLGTYSYLLAFYILFSYLSEFGISRVIERHLAQSNSQIGDDNRFASARLLILLIGLLVFVVLLLNSLLGFDFTATIEFFGDVGAGWQPINTIQQGSLGLTRTEFHGGFYGTPSPVVPEPTTLVLLGLGLAGIGAVRKRSK